VLTLKLVLEGFSNSKTSASSERACPNGNLGAVATLSAVSHPRGQLIIGLILPSTFAMPRLRKSKRPADISVSTPTSPAELLRNFTTLPRGDSRAVGATTTAIALSIGSAFPDTRDTSSDDATVQERDTVWRTAYGAAKMAIETTKESSDLFLPLKAVVGAMAVLIKNYDVGVSC